MFFGRKELREKKFIDYVLEDIPFGLDDMFAHDQGLNAGQNSMRTVMLGPEKGSIENAAITSALKSAWFLSILAGVAENSNIKIPDGYKLYHAMMVEDAWGSTYEFRDGVKWGVRLGDASVIVINAIVKNKFNDLLDHQKQKLLAFIQAVFPEIVSFEHAKAVIAIANKLTVKYQ
jgi:hypothetical protein